MTYYASQRDNHKRNSPTADNDSGMLNRGMHSGHTGLVQESSFASAGQTNRGLDLSRIPAQAKLRIGAPDDMYEREADRVAEQVIAMPSPYQSEQRNIGTGNKSEQKNSGHHEVIQRKDFSSTSQSINPTPNHTGQFLTANGQPMSNAERAFFEPRFGADFSNVRIHSHSQASRAAHLLNARAFTLGHHIAFGSGEYSPSTISGKRLLAHELTHVVQQNGNTSPTLQRKHLSYPFPRTIPDIEGRDILEEPLSPPLPQVDEQAEMAESKTAMNPKGIEDQSKKTQTTELTGETEKILSKNEAISDSQAKNENNLTLDGLKIDNLQVAESERKISEFSNIETGNTSAIGSIAPLGFDSALRNDVGQLANSQSFSQRTSVRDIDSLTREVEPPSRGTFGGAARRSAGAGALSRQSSTGEKQSSDDVASGSGENVERTIDSAFSGGSPCSRQDSDLNQSAVIQLPNYQPPNAPQTDTGDIKQVDSKITKPSGGGILDAIAETLLSQLTNRASSDTQSGKNSANSTTEEATRSATTQAQTGSTNINSNVEGVRNEARTALPGSASRGTTILGGAMRSAFSGVRTLLRRHAGSIRAKVGAWIASGGQTNLLAELLAPVREAINGIIQRIQAAAQRVTDMILGVAQRVTAAVVGVIHRVASLATSIIRAIATALRRVIGIIRSLLNQIITGIVSFARSLGAAIAQFISNILNTVRMAINRIINAVERLVERVISAITAFIQTVAQIAVDFVQSVLQAIINAVQAITNAIRKLIEYFVCLAVRVLRAVIGFIAGLIRRAAEAIAEAVKWLVFKWLEPKIRAALATAREMIERIRRYGERYVAAASEGASRAQQLGHNILQSILKPEGDHFTIGLTGGVGGGGGYWGAGSIGAGVSAVLDMHISYRHSTFAGYLTFSPLEISAGLGVGGGAGLNGSGGLTYGWGSVLSYGRKKNMHESVGGWQISGGVGVEIGGGALGRGSYGIGEQLSTNEEDVAEWGKLAPFGYNPITGFAPPPPGVPVIGGPGFPGTIPGTETPRPPSGGTWSGVGAAAGNGQAGETVRYILQPTELANRSLFFETGKSDIIFDPARVSIARSITLDDLVTETKNKTRNADLWSAQAAVAGHASPRWRHPRQGWTGAEENRQLSLERAIKTRDGLENKMQAQGGLLGSRPTVTGQGAPAGEVDRDQPQQRRADITVTITKYTAQPVPPPNRHEPMPPPGQLPSLGWDTSVSWQAGLEAGAKASATVQVNAGIAYTCPDPLWDHKLSSDESKGLRIFLGLMKVLLDLAHMNQIGLVRDAAGLVGGVEDIIGVELTDPIVNYIFPMPESP